MRHAPSFALLAPVTLAVSLWAGFVAGCADTNDIADDDDPVLSVDDASDNRGGRDAASPTRDAGPGQDGGRDAATQPDASADAGGLVLSDIRDVQQGIVATGERARITGVVTGVDPTANFFFLQDPNGAPAYSGVAVFLGTSSEFAKPELGVTVTLEGTVKEFQRSGSPLSRTNIEDVTLLEIGDEADLPAPAVITPSSNLTNEATAEPYEGVLVQITAPSVTAVPDSFGTFKVTGGVSVAKRLYTYPAPKVGKSFASLTGVLDYDRAKYQIYPRSPADMPAAVAPINLISLTPSTSSVLFGTTQTYTVTLSRAADSAVTLNLSSSAPATATVPATVLVAQGQSSAQFIATTLVADPAPVTIGVALATSVPAQLSAQLNVLATLPDGDLSALAPAILDVLGAVPGRSAAERTGLVQVELDAPAPPGGTRILLESMAPLDVVVPDEVTIPEGHVRGAFRVRADSAVETSVIINALDGDNFRSMTVHVVLSAPAPSLVTKELVINEILYSPPTGGDADCSGKRGTTADEFVEIVNISAHPIDLLNVSVHDATTAVSAPRYKFASRVLGAGEAVLVYGKADSGGTTVLPPPVWCTTPIASTAGSVGDAAMFRAPTSLELGNGGDTVFLTLTTKANVLDKWTYANQAAEDGSLERMPQIGATTTFVRHTLAEGAAADRVMTPGTLADGTPFALASPPSP